MDTCSMVTDLIYDGAGSVKPLVSFVIPTYKNYKFLYNAIDSILNQSNELFSYEIIVISNNPDADLTEFIEKYKNNSIKFYMNQENYGQTGNINLGTSMARGRYVSYLHDDDLLLPNYSAAIAPYVLDASRRYTCILPSYYNYFSNYLFDIKHCLLGALFSWRFFYRKQLQELHIEDNIFAFDNIYRAPSCGALFFKQDLEDFGYFIDEGQAAWDYYNFRLLNKEHIIYRLHKYTGVRRCETGMSAEKKVHEEFRNDKLKFIDEQKEAYPFLVKYEQICESNGPFLHYLFLRVRIKTYFYMHNLDSEKSIPYVLFRKLQKEESRF